MRAPVFEAYDLTIGISPEHQAFAEAHFADRPFAEFLGAQHRVPMTARYFHAVLDFGFTKLFGSPNFCCILFIGKHAARNPYYYELRRPRQREHG
jgi:hypothetical protein